MSGRRIDIFLPLSRADRVRATCEQVLGLDVSGFDVRVQVVADNLDVDVRDVHDLLGDLLDNFVNTYRQGDDETDMGLRRQRVCDVFREGASLVSSDAELVFVLEDDTDIQPDFLQRLVETYDRTSDVGIVSGVECGRWAYRIIGAWNVDDRINPTMIESVVFKDLDECEYVAATGFFCCVVRGELFRRGDFRHGLLGPDFYFGLDCFQLGYMNVVDWTLRCGHATKTIYLTPEMSDSVVRFDLLDGYWVRNQEEDPRDRHLRLQRLPLL